MSEYWTNDDGLAVRFGTAQARDINYPAKTVGNVKEYLVIDFTYDNLPSFTTDANNDGTLNAFNDGDPYIPAGAYITDAFLIVKTAFADGTDYDVGLYTQAGAAIDAVGIDEAVLVASLAANEAHVCDGANVKGTITEASDAYVVVAATGTFTAGEARLVIEYVQTAP